MPERLIVFVCSGNICRSPMAECMFRDKLGPASSWQVASAGLSAAWGMPPSREAVHVLQELGLVNESHRSRPLEHDLVDDAAMIVVMTEVHREQMKYLFPGATDRVYVLSSFNAGPGVKDIEDPIGASEDVYRRVRDEIAAALPGLVAYLEALT